MHEIFLLLNMLKIFSTVIIIIVINVCGFSQDSSAILKKTDTLKQITDSLKSDSSFKKAASANTTIKDTSLVTGTDSLKKIGTDSTSAIIIKTKKDTLVKAIIKAVRPVIKLQGMAGSERVNQTTDLVFYILIFIIFFLALIKQSFPKYFNSIFSLSFQATFRQTQTRQQMSQNFFPAFMLNVLFILSGGLFITLVAGFYKWTIIPFWQLFIYSTTILGMIYSIKYFVILFTGWVFNAPDSAAEYRFIVFLINKLIGVLFIPILFIIAYSEFETKKIVITIALCIAFLLLALRYLVSLARIRKNLKLTAFHFFIYFCAIEVMPLLVIYKLLFIKTSNT